MNRCPACGVIGYKPELPECDPNNGLGIAPEKLRNLFSRLPLRDDGRCDKCHARTDQWGPRADGFGIDE